jgi:hypothetical protein
MARLSPHHVDADAFFTTPRTARVRAARMHTLHSTRTAPSREHRIRRGFRIAQGKVRETSRVFARARAPESDRDPSLQRDRPPEGGRSITRHEDDDQCMSSSIAWA